MTISHTPTLHGSVDERIIHTLYPLILCYNRRYTTMKEIIKRIKKWRLFIVTFHQYVLHGYNITVNQKSIDLWISCWRCDVELCWTALSWWKLNLWSESDKFKSCWSQNDSRCTTDLREYKYMFDIKWLTIKTEQHPNSDHQSKTGLSKTRDEPFQGGTR